MPKIAANLTMLFTEVSFLDRFAAAKQSGFKRVEFLFPYDHPAEKVKEMLDTNNLEVVLFNLPSGNWAGGDRGIGASPNRIEEFRAGVTTAVSYAKTLGVPRMNCLAGKMAPGYTPEEHRKTLVENLRFAADALGQIGVNLLVEHINPYDIPGFFLNRVQEVLDVIAEAKRPNLYVQYDIYHAQRTEGNLTQILRQHFAKIDHIQIADNPGRHQPGTGEINYPFLFAEMDKLGYGGSVGCEYVPNPGTLKSLKWIEEYACQLA
ncbi:MAG TPA: hydroxypyruvate isomerase [Candidatus Methylomirabilis sp.]|nr:hydroxypyruvate isomerase [Candidatus Methylomirabilis sp.]